MMDFAAPAARNNARNRLPYTVKLAFTVADLADAPNAASRDEGELARSNEIEAVDGTPLTPRPRNPSSDPPRRRGLLA